MGKLYDQRDLEFDLDMLDKMEQGLSADIVAGTISGFAVRGLVSQFDKERRVCRMKLLNSGALMRDLRHAERLANACPCPHHKRQFGLLCKRAKAMAEENEARRATLGIVRTDDAATHDGACNQWETWYFSDKREGVWPGDAAYALREYGNLGYRGWLQMLLENEEIPQADYAAELRRLGGAQ